jgi:subtilase family serine protease
VNYLKFAAPLAIGLAIAGCNAGAGSSSLPTTGGQVSSQAQARSVVAAPACSGSRVHQAQCDVLIQRNGIQPTVSGWTSSDLEAAYGLTPYLSNGSGTVVAIVDAYDNPNVASNLATYRSTMGLPAANFYKYNQDGQQGNYPSGSTGWGVEIDLDTQMVSTSCPACTIYLVEANSSNWSDIQTAEAEAVTLGATIVTNSYSGEGASESSYDTPGITYLASSGDGGYGLYDPATFQDVVAVGGTLLYTQKGKRGYTEDVWAIPSCCGTGGGCSSTDEPKPSWQSDPDCKYRTGSDVSAVAWNVAEYDTYGESGWFTVGGTSVSSPLTAGVFALAGNSTSQQGGKTFWTASKKVLKKDLYKVTNGEILECPSGDSSTYLCKAGTNQFGQFSGPDGWGTPHGIGAY